MQEYSRSYKDRRDMQQSDLSYSSNPLVFTHLSPSRLCKNFYQSSKNMHQNSTREISHANRHLRSQLSPLKFKEYKIKDMTVSDAVILISGADTQVKEAYCQQDNSVIQKFNKKVLYKLRKMGEGVSYDVGGNKRVSRSVIKNSSVNTDINC